MLIPHGIKPFLKFKTVFILVIIDLDLDITAVELVCD